MYIMHPIPFVHVQIQGHARMVVDSKKTPRDHSQSFFVGSGYFYSNAIVPLLKVYFGIIQVVSSLFLVMLYMGIKSFR